MAWENINDLCDIVRQTAFDIHSYHRNGHLEKVYENAIAHRLRKRGLSVLQQHPLSVFDEDGAVVGDYFADLFIEARLIVELKACRSIVDEHIAQILGYLKSSRIETGLLINFGGPKLYVKKFLMTPKTSMTRCERPTSHPHPPKLFVSSPRHSFSNCAFLCFSCLPFRAFVIILPFQPRSLVAFLFSCLFVIFVAIRFLCSLSLTRLVR